MTDSVEALKALSIWQKLYDHRSYGRSLLNPQSARVLIVQYELDYIR